jgi:hypothetical protein
MGSRGVGRFVLAFALLLCGCVLLLLFVHRTGEALTALSARGLLRPLGSLETLLHAVGTVVVLVLSGVLFARREPVATAVETANAVLPRSRLSDEPPEITVAPAQPEPDPASSSSRPTFPGVPKNDFEANPYGAITARPDRPDGEIALVSVPNNPVPQIADEPGDDRDELSARGT